MKRGRFARRSALALALGVLVALPAPASAALTFNQVSSASEIPRGEVVTFTMTIANTGPGTEHFQVGTLETRWFGEKAVPNPVQSITGTHGACTIDAVEPPFNYHGATCDVDLPAGQMAQIAELVQVNESMDNLAGVLDSQGAFTTAFKSASVQAIYPPRVEGSKKIKLKGLPSSCVERDFKLTASAKGAKKLTASLGGPYDEWHGRLLGDGFGGKIAAEKGKKLRVDVPLQRERAGFYDLQIAAKFKNGSKQKTEISIQRCGVPEG